VNSALAALLDEEQVSKLSEYLAKRLEIDEGETMLQLQFADGRYQRMQRFVKPRAGNNTHARSGRSGA